jgi:ABC-2 type transport system permease protein
MRLWKVFLKNLRELIRDPLILILTLVFAPCFVMVYAMFFPSGSTSYTVLVLNHDSGVVLADGSDWKAGDEAIAAIGAVTYPDGKPLLRTRLVGDEIEAGKLLRDRTGLVLITIPEDFSSSILQLRDGSLSASVKIIFGGDLTNSYYIIAAIMATSAVDAYVGEATGRPPIMQYIEKPLGGSASRTEFENYVPGLFVFAIVMLVFMAAMTVAREVEAGTLRRLQITCLTSFDFLGGVTISLLLVGVISELLTIGAALAIGFRSQGPLWVAILVGALTSLSVIGSGLIVACFSRTVAQAFVIANFPLAFFMFFTGIMYPIPKIALFSIGDKVIGLFDILPPTHAVAALNKIFTLGANFQEVSFELAMLTGLSVLYFVIGVWLFHKRHMSIG